MFERFGQKSISHFWCDDHGVGPAAGFVKNPTPDFLGKSKQMDFADFFKFELPQAAKVVAGRMDSAKVR